MTRLTVRLLTLLRRARRDDRGSVTILALYIVAGALLASAFAVDFAYLQSARTQLQVAADSAAHAALYYRDTHSAEDAKQMAIELARHDMPTGEYGAVLTAANIEFGDWDAASRTFVPNADATDAVRVRLWRAAESGNAVKTHLFRLLNKDEWDIGTEAIFTTFQPACMREGFVAEGVVDLRSNNVFSEGFCLHSNTYVSLNSNNLFEPGTVVSMPDLSLLDIPNSGLEKNEGLGTALHRKRYRIRILNKLDDIEADLSAGYGEYVPDYITNSIPVVLSGKKFSAADFVEHRVNIIGCTSNQVTIDADSHLRNVVIMADCEVKFGQGVILEDVLMFNSDTSAKSFNAASGLQVGAADNCADGGGAELITRGGVDVAAGLQLHGGRIIAEGDVSFAADATGLQGASIVSGGTISGTSNMGMGFCGHGMDDTYTAKYFRLAM